MEELAAFCFLINYRDIIKSVSSPHTLASWLAAFLCCKLGSLPMSYHGLPLGSSFKASIVWNVVLERIEKRLAGWKKHHLSKDGRLTLLKMSSRFFMGWDKRRIEVSFGGLEYGVIPYEAWRLGGEEIQYF